LHRAPVGSADEPAAVRSQRRLLLAALLVCGAPLTRAQPAGSTLVVGPGERWRTLADAVKAAGSGDTIELHPGTYVGDVAVIDQARLTLRGLGSGALLLADGRHAEGKATLVVRGGDVTIDNLEFRGSRVPSGNGPGIRFEAGRLSVQRCRFFDNETGLLTANRADMALDVRDCEFGQAPRHAGLLHHLLYVGAIGRFNLSGSRFSQGWRAHLVKSRARHNQVLFNWLDDGPLGAASYELEFPNGGHNVVIGNVIGQGAATQNRALLSLGAESPAGAEGSLVLVHNTFVNRAASGRFLHLWDKRFAGGLQVLAVNNLFAGAGVPGLSDAGFSPEQGNHSLALAGLADAANGDFNLPTTSPLRGRAVDVADAYRPETLFTAPAGSRSAGQTQWRSPGALPSQG